MVMTNPSDFPSEGQVESSVQSTNQQHPDSHELPSLDGQSSILSLPLDEFQHAFSNDFESFGSMNIEDLLNSVLTPEEIQAYEQTLVPNPNIAPSTAAPMAAATVPTAAATANTNPQFPEGEIRTATVNDTAVQQSLLRQGSLTLPSPLSQKTVDEVWYEIQKNQQGQEYQEVESVQRQTTLGEMSLEDFLIKAGVVREHDCPPSPLLQQSCVSYQKINNTAPGSGPPGYMIRPVIASGGSRNVPAYQALPERSVKDGACWKMQNNAGGGGQCLPTSPVSSDSAGANQSDSADNRNTGTNAADNNSGRVEKVASRKQRRMIKNRESAARSRARRQVRSVYSEMNIT